MFPAASRTTRLVPGLLGAVLLVGTLTACGSAGEGVDDSAEGEQVCTPADVAYGEADAAVGAQDIDEENLVVYSGRSEDLIGPVLQQFTDETGIEVSVRYGGTPAMTAQILEEGDASPADVFLAQDAGALGALGGADCLAELPEATVEPVAETYRAEDQNWVALTGRARVVVYNPSLVGEADLPADLDGVLDPRWSQQIGIAPGNASFQSMITAIRVLEGEAAAASFLQGLVDNQAQVFEGNADIVAAVNAGQLAMGLVNHYYLYELQAELGAAGVSARNHYLADGAAGSLVNISGGGVVTGTERGEDAQALLDFLLGEQAQAYFAEQTNEYPMVEGAPEPADAPALAELQAPDIDLNDLDSLAQTVQLIQEAGLS